MRDKLNLFEPKPVAKDNYRKELQTHLLGNAKAKSCLIREFKRKQSVAKRVTGKVVCTIAAKKLLNKALQSV